MHALLHSVLPAQQQATTDPCLRCGFLDTPWQVWVSLLWGHYSFLLGPGVHKFCLCPPRVYFPVLCKFWLLYGGVNGDLVIANTLFQQHKRRLYTWTSPDGQYRNQIDYILCSQRWRSSIQSAKTRPRADCG